MEENNEIMNVEDTTDLATVNDDSESSGFGSGMIVGGLITAGFIAGFMGFRKLKEKRRKKKEAEDQKPKKEEDIIDGEAEEVVEPEKKKKK